MAIGIKLISLNFHGFLHQNNIDLLLDNWNRFEEIQNYYTHLGIHLERVMFLLVRAHKTSPQPQERWTVQSTWFPPPESSSSRGDFSVPPKLNLGSELSFGRLMRRFALHTLYTTHTCNSVNKRERYFEAFPRSYLWFLFSLHSMKLLTPLYCVKEHALCCGDGQTNVHVDPHNSIGSFATFPLPAFFHNLFLHACSFPFYCTNELSIELGARTTYMMVCYMW